MKTYLGAGAIAAFVLAIPHAHDIAGAAQSVIKPAIKTPRIIIRPRNVTPKTNRLIKKNTIEGVTNPAATQGGSAPEADSPARQRAPAPLRNQDRATVRIPQERPYDFSSRLGALQQKFPHGNVNELVFLVMRDALKEMNEDKKYFLQKLKIYNDMAEALSDYLSDHPPGTGPAETGNAMAGPLLQLFEAELSAARRAEPKLRASLTDEQFQTLSNIQPVLAADPSSPEAHAAWEAFAEGANSSDIDMNALVQWVLSESYLEATSDLRDYADKVKYYNDKKKAVRKELNGARAGALSAEPCKTTKC
jgi:hypothetical protein